jgi:hypothetical protein
MHHLLQIHIKCRFMVCEIIASTREDNVA